MNTGYGSGDLLYQVYTFIAQGWQDEISNSSYIEIPLLIQTIEIPRSPIWSVRVDSV